MKFMGFFFFFRQFMYIGIRKANVHNLHVWLKNKCENMFKIFVRSLCLKAIQEFQWEAIFTRQVEVAFICNIINHNHFKSHISTFI